jgi:hypothetical protein
MGSLAMEPAGPRLEKNRERTQLGRRRRDQGITADGFFYYAMELLEGGPLRHYFNALGRLSPRTASIITLGTPRLRLVGAEGAPYLKTPTQSLRQRQRDIACAARVRALLAGAVGDHQKKRPREQGGSEPRRRGREWAE